MRLTHIETSEDFRRAGGRVGDALVFDRALNRAETAFVRWCFPLAQKHGRLGWLLMRAGLAIIGAVSRSRRRWMGVD